MDSSPNDVAAGAGQRRTIAVFGLGVLATLVAVALVIAVHSWLSQPSYSGSDPEFLGLVHGMNALPTVDDDHLVKIGHSTCNALRAGASLPTAMQTGLDAGFPAGDVSTVTGLSVRVYCPDQTQHIGIISVN